ncbi:hypothetical protein TSMEX_009441 [Taenia solium]|eukprot:TsM_000501900 transcript=TsM_000501900 gene=TsM_000501900
MGFAGLLLKITWTSEASYELKKQSDERLSLSRQINKLGNFCLHTIRNAVMNTNTQRTTSGRRNG